MSEQQSRNYHFGSGLGSKHTRPTFGIPKTESSSQVTWGPSDLQPAYEFAEPSMTSGSPEMFSSQWLSSPGWDSSWNQFDESSGNAHLWQQWDEQYTSAEAIQEQTSAGMVGAGMPMNYYLTTLSSPQGDQQGGELYNGYYDTIGLLIGSPPTDHPMGETQTTNSHYLDISSSANRQTQLRISPRSSKPKVSRSSTSKKSQRDRVTKHNSTEKTYRGRLNSEFATLLAALPREVGVATLQFAKVLSKMEVLDLAKKHLHDLEKEESKLEEENHMLMVQVELLKRLYTSCGGQLMP